MSISRFSILTIYYFYSLFFLHIPPHIQDIVTREKCCHEGWITELVDGEDSSGIFFWLYLDQGNWCKTMSDKWYICRYSRCSFIEIDKCLKIRYKYEYKQTLFEWIMYGTELVYKCLKLRLDHRGIIHGLVS